MPSFGPLESTYQENLYDKKASTSRAYCHPPNRKLKRGHVDLHDVFKAAITVGTQFCLIVSLENDPYGIDLPEQW